MSFPCHLEDETTFSRSLRLHEPDDLLLQLLEDLQALKQENVNFFETEINNALIFAISRPTMTIAKKLIQLGADVNYQDENEWTPLHSAIDASNSEAVFMLLYYNVDVTVCCNNMNPIFRAIHYKRSDIVDILLDYYFEEPQYVQAVLFLTSLLNTTSLNTEFKPLVDFPDTVRWHDVCRYLIAIYDFDEMFELLYPYIEPSNSVHVIHFIFQHISSRFCDLNLFIKYLFAMLDTPLAYDLANLYNKQLPTFLNDKNLIQNLFQYYRTSQSTEYSLTTILYACMSLGIEILPHNFIDAYYLFGYGKELEALIFAGNIKWPTNGYDILYPIPAHIVFSEATLNLDNLFNFLITLPHEPEVLQTLEYFTVPSSVKSQIGQEALMCKNLDTLSRLKRLPTISTLVELCRSEVRRCLILSRRYERAYEYLDAIKILQLPETLRDIILFKKSLYG